MKICLNLKIIVCGLLCVFPVDFKGQKCQCSWNGVKCTSCKVGCYLLGGLCYDCQPNCVSCSSKNECYVCRPGYYLPRCDIDCVTCQNGSCANNVCTYGCVDGYYQNAGDASCRRCNTECVTCNSSSECTSCIAGRTGLSCQNCTDAYQPNNGQCIPCNTNCLFDHCFNNGSGCADGCKNGWSCLRCNDTCPTTCDSCERYNTSTCNSCSLNHYGTSCEKECSTNCVAKDGLRQCSKYTGDCNSGCVNGWTGSKCTDERTQDAQTSANVAVIGGAVGSAVMVVLVVAAVLVIMYLRKRRRNISDPEKRITYDNRVNIEDDNVYSVPDKKRIAKENVDKTQSTDISDLEVVSDDCSSSDNNLFSIGAWNNEFQQPRFTPSKVPVTDGDVIYGNMGGMPVIPSELSVDVLEDNLEELCEDEVNSGDPKEADAPNAEDYYNIYGLTRSRVQVDTLRDHVASISTEDFEREFKKLPKGLRRPHDDAVKPTNALKNRYKGIYPYDLTRVKLNGNGGDYINASYIQGFEENEKTYIASLGPTEKFMKGYVEFWEMVWQEKVDKIVMLTNFMEKSKMKCEKYWPDVGEHKIYGDINVHCMSDERYADFTVTKLTMNKDSQVSSIHHFHLTAWPDQGTPENVVTLVEFRESVERVPKFTEGPTVVHCSAGIGRTGTYIALDILTREGRSDNYVDVYGCVLGLRGQRVLMVQNVEQYRFLHYALSHSLTNKCDQIASMDFCTVKTDEIQEQFQLLVTVNVLNSDAEKKAFEKNKKEKYKNRKGASIPGDAHRPRLFKYNQNSKSDYINAIYVEGYKEKHRYIIAQTPLARTVEDFLGLVLQENCSCIISLDPVGVTSKQDIGDYLPDVNQELSVGKLKANCVQRDITPEYILSKLNVCVQEVSTEESKTILHYQYTEWPEESPVPSSARSFLNLVLESRHTVRDPNMQLEPVLIHCLYGGDRSGLFPVVANILEKIDSEQQASIVNVVSQVRVRRPSVLTNKEQFKYCYELASLFVENNSVYSNLL